MTTTQTATPPTSAAKTGELIYRFEGSLGELYPLGVFPEGIRFHNQFEGRVVAGPFAGGRIIGLDEFLLRPDGVGEIVAPEVVDTGDVRIGLQVRGYVVPPEGAPVPPLDLVVSPGFEFPDVDFRVTGSALIRTVAPEHAKLNRTVAVIEGTVNMATGRLEVEARAA